MVVFWLLWCQKWDSSWTFGLKGKLVLHSWKKKKGLITSLVRSEACFKPLRLVLMELQTSAGVKLSQVESVGLFYCCWQRWFPLRTRGVCWCFLSVQRMQTAKTQPTLWVILWLDHSLISHLGWEPGILGMINMSQFNMHILVELVVKQEGLCFSKGRWICMAGCSYAGLENKGGVVVGNSFQIPRVRQKKKILIH